MLLGIRLEQFEYVAAPPVELIGYTGVYVVICNAGGTQNGNPVGGCNVAFVLTRTDNGWAAEPTHILDP
jgi:hypothetical protein